MHNHPFVPAADSQPATLRDALEDLYSRLSDLEKSAVSEGLYDPGHLLDLACFEAKYGSLPPWQSFDEDEVIEHGAEQTDDSLEEHQTWVNRATTP